MKSQEKEEEVSEDAAAAPAAAEPDPEVTGGPEQTDSGTGNPETRADAEKDE